MSLDSIIAGLSKRITEVKARVPSYEWAAVASVSPVTVVMDSDATETPIPVADVQVANLAVDDRVEVRSIGSRRDVIARAGGVDLSPLTTDITDLQAADVLTPRAVIPSSVVVGSGSASVAADGTVTFTAVSSVSLNGVFDGTGADRYELVFDFVTSDFSFLSCRLRGAGTDAASGYDSARFTVINTTISAVQTSNASNWVASGGNGPANSRKMGTMSLARPGLAEATVAAIENNITPNPMTTSAVFYLGKPLMHRTAAAYDGITFFENAGTMTGTMRVVKIA